MRLEPCAVKVARTVPRRRGWSNLLLLFDHLYFKTWSYFFSGNCQGNRKSAQIEKRKSRAFTPALSPAKSQGAGGSLRSLYISVCGKKHFSSPPQPRDKRGIAGVNRAAICVSRFAEICGFFGNAHWQNQKPSFRWDGWIVTIIILYL